MGTNAVMYQRVGLVAVVTLNRPEKRNAINDAVLDGLEEAFDQALREDMRVVVLRGAGESFSVGYDLGTEGTSISTPLSPMSAPLTPNERYYLDDYFTNEAERRVRLERIFNFPRFTVARVQGYCLGSGCDLAMMCDYIICSEDAVFGDPSVRQGNVSANPLWVYRVGMRKAKELLLLGRYFDGKEAEACGLVSRAVSRGELDETVEQTVATLFPKGDVHAFDARVGRRFWDRVAKDSAGLAAAWGSSANYAAMSQVQRFGFNGDFEFWKVRAESGWKEAVRQRDEKFDRVFPSPKPAEPVREGV